MSTALQSIFEVFAVGAGPSSTHSMGPQRAARLFAGRLGSESLAWLESELGAAGDGDALT